ncbi:MAG TPA: hypothetical protein PKM73_18115 [Verrucomicrobiota bacterium]|nr:hypothetical protein [Verrucomicrobiota bacterium]HNU53350.1 hypothetical protein [Verrucomicrobiota bacterium]
MANVSLFTHPGTFKRMNPENLRKWLEPARGYLAGRGLALPLDGASSPIDYDRLAWIFMEPDGEMPRDLMHSASLIHEMSTENAMLDLLDGARRVGLPVEVGEDPDPVDVAVQVWLQAPAVLEELHQMHQLDRPRGFIHFVTDRKPDPSFDGPTAEAMTDLEAELADWFFHAKRGRHAKVWMYRRPGEYWFLVRHGLASKRQEVVSASGADTLIFRPGEYDVLVYNRKRGELRVHGCNPREVEVLRTLFGKHIFYDKDFFPGGAKFTLAPLVRDGRACLACADVTGIEDILLTEVQILAASGNEWLRSTHHASDLFTAIETERVLLPDAESLVRASFLVRFSDSKKRRTIKILGSNRLSVVRDGDTALMERWLDARGFILKRSADEQEPQGVLASA